MSITESPSNFDNLENMSSAELLAGINREDHEVPKAINKALPQIEALVEAILPRMQKGGRVFYIGAGTSGRLGVLDASELPPTFGVSPEVVKGLIAGGDTALRSAVESAEDDPNRAWEELKELNIGENDSLIGIAASGRTPYVIGGLKAARKEGLLTGCIVCNPGSAVALACEFPVEVVVGPEFVTGSTRMKSGTAQKLVLNMISTTLMIKLGKVKGNKMVNMQLTNEKLVDRGTKMIMAELNLGYDESQKLLLEHGSVKNAVEAFKKD